VELGVIVAHLGFAQNGRDGLAFATHLGADHTENQLVRDELSVVHGRLSGIVGARSGRGTVIDHHLYPVAARAAFGIDVVHRHFRAFPHGVRDFGIRPGQGQRNADPNHLLLGRGHARQKQAEEHGEDKRDRSSHSFVCVWSPPLVSCRQGREDTGAGCACPEETLVEAVVDRQRHLL
jgi:hypothetical protein